MIKSLEGFAPYAPYLIPLTGLAFHELGHFLCGLAFGKVLRFRFRGLRLVWTMPGGLKAWQRALIAATGWIDLDAATVIQLAGAVREHVQKAFSKERDLAEQVAIAGSVQEVQSVEW